MTGILHTLIAGVSGAVKDTYFNLVSLLLPGNGTNGKKNNDFVDSSSNNFFITPNGDVTQGTFSPFSQTGWGAYFDGSNDYLSIANNSAFNISTGDFTLETWVYINSLPSSGNTEGLITITNASIVNYSSVTLRMFIDSAAKIVLDAGSSSTGTSTPLFNITSANAISLNTFTHIAFVRSGSTFVLYINGKAEVTASSSATLYWDSSKIFNIAADGGGTRPSDGYFSNLRLVTSQALFTGSTVGTTYFTPSIQPLTTTSIGATGSGVAASLTGTVALLTCQANRFRDASNNNLTITANNGAAITPFSPFAPTSSYSAAAVGGSGYFDGSGDYLTVPDSTALDLPGDFTIECWLYRTANTNNTILYTIGNYSGSNNGFTLYVENGNNLRCYGNGGFIFTGTAGLVPLNAWVHIALIRSGSGSNNMKAYINGVLDTAAQASNNSSWTGVAGNGFSPGAFYDGTYNAQTDKTYMAGMRLVKGQALASGDFTPPTAPVTTSSVGWTGANAAGSLTGTISLLLNFTNAGVVDAAAKNVLETEGNAQISTAQSKWGGGSIAFDGTGDWLRLRDTDLFNPQTSDFTIEAWVYVTSLASTAAIYARESTTEGGTLFLINSSGTLGINLATSGSTYGLVLTGGSVSTNAWTYVAAVRSGSGTNNIKLYINGSQVNQGTFGGSVYNPSSATPIVGARNTNGDLPFTGYIDDFRFTRYARTITASPTAPFPVQ